MSKTIKKRASKIGKEDRDVLLASLSEVEEQLVEYTLDLTLEAVME